MKDLRGTQGIRVIVGWVVYIYPLEFTFMISIEMLILDEGGRKRRVIFRISSISSTN